MANDSMKMFDYSNCKTYLVKENDNLFEIAMKYNVALQQLRYFNNIDKGTMRIRKGQTLYIPNNPVYVPAGE